MHAPCGNGTEYSLTVTLLFFFLFSHTLFSFSVMILVGLTGVLRSNLLIILVVEPVSFL